MLSRNQPTVLYFPHFEFKLNAFLSVTEFFTCFVESSHQKMHEFSILRVQEFFNFTQGFLSVKRNGCA